MTSEYCPRECPYLNITEENQQKFKTDLPDEFRVHICLKYNARLWHLLAHPDLYKCNECYRSEEAGVINESKY